MEKVGKIEGYGTRVLIVHRGNGLQDDCTVPYSARQRADSVEGRRQRYDTGPAHQSVRRLDADEATRSGRQTNRTAGVGAEGSRNDTSRHHGPRTRGGTATNVLQVPWVGRRPRVSVVSGRAEG